MSPVRGVIGVPTVGWVQTPFMTSMVRMQAPRDVEFYAMSNVLTSVARNQIVESAIEKGAKWVFFADSDQTFHPDTLIRLLNHDVDIVGGLYFQRVAPFDPIAYDVIDDGAEQYRPISQEVIDFMRRYSVSLTGKAAKVVAPFQRDHLRKVGGIGTGCLLIKASVFKAMLKPWFQYSSIGGSEDLYFCRQARRLGYDIYVDLGVQCGHMTTAELGLTQFCTVQRMKEDESGAE